MIQAKDNLARVRPVHGTLQFTPSLSREVISVRSAQKSRELRREMLRKQHFCGMTGMPPVCGESPQGA